MCHKVMYWWYTDLRAGGASGYLGNLQAGLQRAGSVEPIGPEIIVETVPRVGTMSTTMEVTAETLRAHTGWFSTIDDIRLNERQCEQTLAGRPRSLHFHSVTDCLMTIQSLKSVAKSIPVLFTCHSPEAFSKEFADLWRAEGFGAEDVLQLQQAVEAVELRAFKESDIWIFPCVEALEGYDETLPGFRDLRRDKDIRFVRSGVVRPTTAATRDAARQRCGLKTPKMVAYLGRHNSTKGYDVFCRAGTELLERNSDVTIVVAGRPGPLPAPSHPRWVELGWYSEPGEILQAADVLVVPNHVTYYDLILLEALSLGVPVVASATGGNKEASRIAHGAISLFDRGDHLECLAQVEAIIHDTCRAAFMSQRGLTAYHRFCRPEVFARSYQKLIHQIWSDYSLYDETR